MLPDYAVVGSIKAKISDRFGIREEIGEQGAEFETKILDYFPNLCGSSVSCGRRLSPPTASCQL